MVSIQEAVNLAKAQYLEVPGIVGVGTDKTNIIFYVEEEKDIGKVPGSFAGYPCRYVISGRFEVF